MNYHLSHIICCAFQQVDPYYWHEIYLSYDHGYYSFYFYYYGGYRYYYSFYADPTPINSHSHATIGYVYYFGVFEGYIDDVSYQILFICVTRVKLQQKLQTCVA